MNSEISSLLAHFAGLVIGGGIGALFGLVQDNARRAFEKAHPDKGMVGTGTLTPGSMTRVAALLVALAVVQGVCPMLFSDSTQWWVSAGVVIGYGWMLYTQLKVRRSAFNL